MFDVHQFHSRFDWTLAASGGAYMKQQMFGTVGRATVPAETGRHGGRPYDSTIQSFFLIGLAAFQANGGADPPPAEHLKPIH